ncbi:MAG: polysaccharide deacetylase family protein [Clostridia bacterium]|nr:polysaccharide deacetylase family protein [Clostridia bacterium]
MRIALTFDDGPNTTTTSHVLDLLEREGIAGTFFLIADNITPDSVKSVHRALAMGCDIENHSVTHSPMSQMMPEQIRQEVGECTRRIMEITGKEPSFFRPPFIAVSQPLFDHVDLTFICGSGCEDWVPTVSAEERARRTLENAKDGEIILLHDTEGNENTVEALKTIIPTLKKRGFTFHTVAGLFKEYGITPVRNRLYSNVFQTIDRPDLVRS